MEKRRRNYIKKFGKPSHNSSTNREKAKETCLKQYGVENPSQIEEIKKKKKETCLKHFGVVCNFMSEETKEKIKKTNLQKYGYERASCSDKTKNKAKENCLKKYGVESTNQLKEVKAKKEKKAIKKFGVKCTLLAPKIKIKAEKTIKQKYGVTNVFSSKEIKQKIKKTNIQKYGYEYATQSMQVQRKIYYTKKERNNFNVSKDENFIFDLLSKKYKEVKRNYRSEKYPFVCDFYIPELDLYIEYQGYCSHGSKIFDSNDKKDLEKLNHWKEKAKEINFKGKRKKQYDCFIKIWTISDPLKRKTAKENNLNWIEFFTIKEFLKWYNNLEK